MSNGILQFTLGLATGGFLSKLGEAKAGITGFIGGLIGVGAIVEGVHKAIDKGAELERLHKQTGIASGTLFQLQEGFKAAGLGADEAGPLMLRMQRAIGGVNEMGESTSDIFRRMGLNIADLKKLDAPQQFQSILHAISGLDSSSAAMAAGSIFGRFGFGDIIQLTRSTKEFGAAMKRSAEDAKEWQRVSAAFEQFKISLNRIKEIAEGFFGGIAAGVVPALQKGLDYL
ncbi:MAG: hypothetical protein KGL39_50185, partial [Patescibacteria group bacterium]|nr:hypothetical protein [Patescibacteria group bacterium]